ncbi:MAG TPA: DinB family protein [Vicinamibacteria bacterium]|jgi:uncharacterized damage-inducible protein DinB|nr:DinB family protein [Vicinamibacteria bacterium]
MTNKDALGRLLEYTTWANHRIVRSAATLSVDDFKRDLGSSHGGVRGTLAHMLGAEWLWLERFKGVSPPRMIDEGEFPDVLALRERWRVVEEHRKAWFKSLREQAVREKVRYQNLKGRPFEAPLWQLVQHVANHSTYHRGQVTTLLRFLKARVVSTDLVFWDRERAERRRARG